MNDATAQQINAFVAQPINNLIVFLAVIALFIVGGIVVLIWKFAPPLINLYREQVAANKKLTENNEKLTAIQQENLTQRKTEHAETKTELEKQTVYLKAFTDFQKANNETVGNLVEKIGGLEERVTTNTDKIAELKHSIDALSEQIKNMLEDKAACADVEERITKLRDEILALVTQQQAKKTTEINAVIIPQATVIDGSESKQEKAG